MTNTVQTSGKRLRAVSVALALAIVLVPAVVGTKSAKAQTLTVLYTFTGGADGGTPWAGLVRDSKGNLYGTTYGGGSSNCRDGCGVVFKVDTAGKETVLHSFTDHKRDGNYSFAGLLRDVKGNLYGTAARGGASDQGIVFKLSKTGRETVLHNFTGKDGSFSVAGLVSDAKGNLYGTTEGGGSSGDGTVFMLDTAGKERVLHSFTNNGGDGALPCAGLVRDAKGNLYGAAGGGPHAGCGMVFKLDKAGKETVLYSFTCGADGQYPNDFGYLVRDVAGNLYGTTWGGGAYGGGTVFKVAKNGEETVLYSFTGGADGGNPWAGLIQDAQGNFYGTAWGGGAYGGGTVFKVDGSGTETVLYSFTGGADGAGPYAPLMQDAKGNLYGTTSGGGAYDYGTVFELTP